MFLDDNQSEDFANLEKGQSFEKTFSSIPLVVPFLFKGSVDTMVKMLPSAEKGGIVSYKVDGFHEKVLSIQMVCEVVEFIHLYKFNGWKFDFWDWILSFFGISW